MAFTAANVSAQRALQFGLVNSISENREELLKNAIKMAEEIASHSPLVIQGAKNVMNYADEHSLSDGKNEKLKKKQNKIKTKSKQTQTQTALNQVAFWNTSFLMSDDLMEAITSFLEKRKPVYRNKL